MERIGAVRSSGSEDVRHCVTESIEAGDGEEEVEELMSAVVRFSGR